ncbi:MAG TPA: hypothetical protein VE442_02675 [Jatrophihabitans sp.]|nr:hypothetical protein [Jatrophihabitans sp.]
MHEPTDRLAELSALRATEPTEATVQADVQRGRAALKRRRVRRATAGVALTAALATAASLTYASRFGSSGHSNSPEQVKLVAYTGAQPPGFTISEVPEGYVLQGATSFNLDIAQPGDHTSLDAFEGKLVVMLQSRDAKTDTSGTPVTVNGHPGYLRQGPPAKVLEYTDGTHDILVQDWQDVALTDDQLIEFASGVTVTSEAQAGVG